MYNDDVAISLGGAESPAIFLFGHVHRQLVGCHCKVRVDHLDATDKDASSRLSVKLSFLRRNFGRSLILR